MTDVTRIGQAKAAGWRLELKCGRRHAGLKSVRPCTFPAKLDLLTLIAVFGPDLPLEELDRRLMCPQCGSRHFRLLWTAGPSEPVAPRVMRPIMPGETLLRDYDGEFIIVSCAACRRRGEYRVATLLAMFGPDAPLLELRFRIAAERGCRAAGDNPPMCRFGMRNSRWWG